MNSVWYYNGMILQSLSCKDTIISLYEIILSKFLSGRGLVLQHLPPAAGGNFSMKKSIQPEATVWLTSAR